MIYLDYNATHPPHREVIAEANQVYTTHYGNSSGRSSFSQQSKQLIEKSRKKIADIFAVSENQIVFTSSATEANFLAIELLCRYLRKTQSDDSLVVGVSPLEHPSITEALKKCKPITLHTLPLKPDGQINLTFLKNSLKKKRFDLLVCTLVHSETGIVQPWKELVSLAHTFSIPLICDVVQAVSRLQRGIDSSGLSLEMFSVSQKASVFFTMCGHKIGAGFGTGVMMIPSAFLDQKLSHFTPYYESHQEFSLRPGTHNLPAIIAFEKVLSERVKKKRIMLN